MRKIELPKQNKKGKPTISYSQYSLFKSLSSFNLKDEGYKEYVVKYFLGYKFADKGWAEFGNDVEDYICKREKSEKFKEEEKKVLNKIEPLGIFQDKFEIDFGDFTLNGIIDDRAEDWSKIIDYKTCSLKSLQQYKTDDYTQMDFYAMKAIEVTGNIPEMEVCAVERLGNCYYEGGREVLTVGENIWRVDRCTTQERLELLKEDLFLVVYQISELYKVFLKTNK